MKRNRATYNSCSELPLYNFIQIIVHDRMDMLYSEPAGKKLIEVDLQPIWENIYNEYSELSSDEKGAHIFLLVNELTGINNKLWIVQSAVDVLSQTYDKRLCDMLRKLGYRFPFAENGIIEDLKKVVIAAGRLIIRKQEAEQELEKLNSGEKSTEKDYNALVVQLSKYMQFRINTKEVSVMEFVNYIEAFKQEHKSQNNGR